MTHKDIYTKFMIEYDKANVTSSYPSLTEYEVATVLDKAYNALIAQKITGNNVRRSTFEADTKAIADIQPLIVTTTADLSIPTGYPGNVKYCTIPNDPKMLYFISSFLQTNGVPAEVGKRVSKFQKRSDAWKNSNPENASGSRYDDYLENLTYGYYHDPIDGELTRRLPVRLVTHDIASKFFTNGHNIPWIKDPVCYIENDHIYFVHDPIDAPVMGTNACSITYIKKPNTFVKDLTKPQTGWSSYFEWSGDSEPDAYTFECNSTVAEELISLAIAFALENVESQRLNSKLNMRGLEA